ncbi:MAG: Uma2 family endonuclease [Verrucomicrobiota bacterium]
MGAPVIIEPVKTEWTEAEYLADVGLDPQVRYEYLRGKVYAMSTPSAAHAEISSNFFAPLHQHLRGKPCRPYLGNMALKINFLGNPAYYIPDVMVACDDKPAHTNHREEPLVLMEIMSPSTASIDQREKRVAYTALPSLWHYLIVNSLKKEVFHYSRSGQGWTEIILTVPEEGIRIPELDFSLTVGELYEQSGL